MKIGFLGGSFDPVHFGHLLAAQDAYESQGLDRLVFVPAAQAPLKAGLARASVEDRLAMLRAALAGDARFEISTVEVERGGTSYTIDSARHFRARYPKDELYWIIGGDQVAKLPQWREAGELARLVEFIVLERPGHPVGELPPIPGLRLHRHAGHEFAVSSTELRDRVRRGLSLDYFVPHTAVAYIRERGLYLETT